MKAIITFSLFAVSALAGGLDSRQRPKVSMSSKATSKYDPLPPRAGAPNGVKRVKGTYGPFTIPGYNTRTSMSQAMGEGGMAMPSMSVKPPVDDATFTYIKADMVFKDGTVANYNSGVYLHHMMMVNVGGRSNYRNTFGNGGGGMPGMFFSVGNNRSPLVYPGTGTYLPKGTTFMLSSELASMNDDPTDIYITVDYEWLPGKPAGYSNILAISQDASRGKPSPPAGKSSFVLTSRPITLSQGGKVLSQYGHLHDGGIHTEIYVNGKLACDSKCAYGADPTYIQTGNKAGLNNSALGTPAQIAVKGTLRTVVHISKFSACPGGMVLNKGDKLVTKAYYNYTERPTLLNLKGQPTELMAISMTFLAVPMPA